MARKRTIQGGAAHFLGLVAMRPLWPFFRRRTPQGRADPLAGMAWREFELALAQAFRMQGYTVTGQGGAWADGGVDLLVRKGRDTFLVQCSQWKATTVGVDVIRQLGGVVAAEGAAGGFVITSGTFTEGAQAFAHGRNLMLVDGPKLLGLIQQARESLRPVAPAPPPACPACNASMLQRTAQEGSRAGSQFWGCSRFPACLGIR